MYHVTEFCWITNVICDDIKLHAKHWKHNFHDKDSLLYITGDQIWTFLSFRGLISDFVLSAHLKKTKYTFSYYLTNIVLVSCVLFIYFF